MLGRPKKPGPPAWFTVVALLALVWNGAGVASFIRDLTISPEALQAMPEAQRALHLSTPAWAWGAYAVATLCGALGSLLLVLRKQLAVPLFMLSLAGVLVQMFHAFFVARAANAGTWLPLVVIAVAVYLVIFSMQARNRGWAR